MVSGQGRGHFLSLILATGGSCPVAHSLGQPEGGSPELVGALAVRILSVVPGSTSAENLLPGIATHASLAPSACPSMASSRVAFVCVTRRAIPLAYSRSHRRGIRLLCLGLTGHWILHGPCAKQHTWTAHICRQVMAGLLGPQTQPCHPGDPGYQCRPMAGSVTWLAMT